MKSYIIFFALLFNATLGMACINASQHKLFPVGTSNGNIVTVDVQVRRTSVAEGAHLLGIPVREEDEWETMWVMNVYIATYNQQQLLLSSELVDTVCAVGDSYTKVLQKSYTNALNTIRKKYPDIELFTPRYISFCDYQKECKLLTLSGDTVASKDYLTYKNRKYELEVVRDTAYYAFAGNPYYFPSTEGMYVSSVRKYQTPTTTMVVAHLEAGHETGMGWITSDPNRKPKDEYDTVILAREHTPDVRFTDIRKAVYQEPLLHHGFGYDVFIVEKR